MATQVQFKNPRTGKQKDLKVGFSWTCLFFSWFLGVPLFLRKLNAWGGIAVGYWFAMQVLNQLVSFYEPYGYRPGLTPQTEALRETVFLLSAGAAIPLALIGIGVSVWLGFKANEMAAKKCLQLGWQFAEPQSATTAKATAVWRLTADAQRPPQP